uniref:Uncharacterized protein n=1 Tax=Cucumis melo TaxID=3656 RepID=A0A9I9DCV3_CUCME
MGSDSTNNVLENNQAEAELKEAGKEVGLGPHLKRSCPKHSNISNHFHLLQRNIFEG